MPRKKKSEVEEIKATESVEEAVVNEEVKVEEEPVKEPKLTLTEARAKAEEEAELVKDHTEVIQLDKKYIARDGTEVEGELLLDGYATEVNSKLENKLMTKIISQLKEVCRKHNLSGLSAPQIGWDRRIVVINFNGVIKSYLNPMPTGAEGIVLSKETCSCLPDKVYLRPRNRVLTVAYETPLGQIKSEKFIGAAARVMQHQMDHLNGLSIRDIGLEIDDDFEKAPEDEQVEVIKAYIDSLDLRLTDLNEEIDGSEELTKMKHAMEFMRAVTAGEVKLSVE